MAIRLAIDHVRIEDTYDRKGFWIQHPSNDAILAYCDTAEEANRVAKDLEELGRKYRYHRGQHRSQGDVASWCREEA